MRRLCGGSEATLGSGRSEALFAVETANYPTNLATARRMQRRGRLDLGEAARNIFSAIVMRDAAHASVEVAATSGTLNLTSPRQKVSPTG